MPRKAGVPRLELVNGYYRCRARWSDGRRTAIGFGPAAGREEEVQNLYGQWLRLYLAHPDKTLSCRTPYEAVRTVLDPSRIISVRDLADKYRQWAAATWPPRRDGRVSPHLERLDSVLTFLAPYRDWRIADFGPDELGRVRDALVAYRYVDAKGNEKRYCRKNINARVSIVRRMWQWGIGREITTVAQCHRLRELAPLRQGRTSAPDTAVRATITEAEFEKVIAELSHVVADMAQVQWLTSMRPSEVCGMQPRHMLMNDPECWVYIPGREVSPVGDHKTAFRGRVRAIPLVGQALEIVKLRCQGKNQDEHLFQPKEALDERLMRRARSRKTPPTCGNTPGSNRKDNPMIKPGNAYKPSAYNHALHRACMRAGVVAFTPYDIRRSSATRIRAKLNKEAASTILGHASLSTTDVYMLDEVQEAIRVAKRYHTPA